MTIILSIKNVLFSFILFASICPLIISGRRAKFRSDLNPVLIFPGLGGSQLEAKLFNDTCCRKAGPDFFLQWLNLGYLTPVTFECLIDVLKLVRDDQNHLVQNPNSTIQVPNFGSTKSVEFIDPNLKVGPGVYLHNLVKNLVKKGYKRDLSIRAVGYDWRLGIGQLESFFKATKKVIEETSAINSGKRVNIICHSLGCLQSIHFLNSQSLNWRNKYIHGYITLAGPWGGSTEALQATLIGLDFKIPLLGINKFRDMERTFPSILELLPRLEVFGNQVLIETPEKNFTAKDYAKVFKFIECDDCLINLHDLLLPNISFPSVNTTCIFGSGITTPSKFRYLFKSHKLIPYVYGGYGDGVVNSVSLQYCNKWLPKRGNNRLSIYEVDGINHGNIVDEESIVDLFMDYL